MAERPPLVYPEHFPSQAFGSAAIQQLYISHHKLDIVPPPTDQGYPDFSQTFGTLPLLETTFLEDDLESARRRMRPLRRPPNDYWEEKSTSVSQNMEEWHDKHGVGDLANVFLAGLPPSRTAEAIQYLNWYTHSLCQPMLEAQQRVTSIRQNYLGQDLAHLAATGIVPPHAAELIKNGVDSVKRVFAIDPFEAGYNQHVGEYRPYERSLGISALILDTPEMYVTTVHESIHSGTDEGLCKIMPVETTELTWLDEAFVEHLTQVVTDEQPHTIDPDARQGKKGVYTPERKLLSLITYGLEQPITLRHFGDAYFEPCVVSSLPRMQLKSLLCQPHPITGENLMGSVELIAESYNKHEISRKAQEDLLRYWIARFTPISQTRSN